MRIALIGKSGMLGSAFCDLLADDSRCELSAFSSAELDVTDFEAVRSKLSALNPDFVINCSGYTNVDLAESEREQTFLLNADSVGNLGKLSISLGFGLIHFSTDYVFSGLNENGYFEEDNVDPVNVYGESKAAGERMLVETGARAFIVRTSWLFGPGGKNFVATMLGLASGGEVLRVVGDQVGSPTFTFDLARAVIGNLIFEDRDFGIYHLTNQGSVSWYDFAVRIFDVAGLDVAVKPVSSAEFMRKARRPQVSVLKNSKLPLLRPYEEALKEYMGLHFK